MDFTQFIVEKPADINDLPDNKKMIEPQIFEDQSNDTIEEEQWLEEIHNGDEKAIKTQKWLEGEPKVKWNFGLEVYYNDRNRGRKYQKQH